MDKMIEAFKVRTIESAIEGFVIEQNDEITNGVRAYLDNLSEEEIGKVMGFLYKLLNYCYDGKIIDCELENDYNKIKELNEKDKFLLKERVIYFMGRLSIPCDIEVLKKAYSIDEDKYVKLNITFASLQTFDESIELDFVNRLLSDDEYDLMIRSWTMAFFKKESNPYDYRDKESDDWTPAKNPRINRLRIDDEANPKYKKAMAFRLLDLAVIYLFVKNRKENTLADDEKEVIKNTNIEYELYSESKKELMSKIKEMILENRN